MSETIEERQRDVWLASQRYMNGEIEIDALKKVEKIHAEKLRFALLTLSKRIVQRRMLYGLLKVLRVYASVSFAF